MYISTSNPYTVVLVIIVIVSHSWLAAKGLTKTFAVHIASKSLKKYICSSHPERKFMKINKIPIYRVKYNGHTTAQDQKC